MTFVCVDFEDENAGVAFDAFGLEIGALLGQNPESDFMRTAIANLIALQLNELGEFLFLPFDSPELRLVKLMEDEISPSDFRAIKQQASSLVPLLQDFSNGLQEDATKQFKAFANAIVKAFSSGAENHGYEVTLEDPKRHNVWFLSDLSESSFPEFKAVRDLDPGLFLELNPKARQYMKYPSLINVVRLAKALYFRTCASLLLSSGNQRLTLWPEQNDSEEVVLHISGVHEVAYLALDGHRKSIFCIQTREGLTFDMERMVPLMPSSNGRLGPGRHIRQGILSCLPIFRVPYMVVKDAMVCGGFTVDEKSRDYIDRDVDNSRIVDATDQNRNQDEHQKLEPLGFFSNSLSGVTVDGQPYKDILAQVANDIAPTTGEYRQ